MVRPAAPIAKLLVAAAAAAPVAVLEELAAFGMASAQEELVARRGQTAVRTIRRYLEATDLRAASIATAPGAAAGVAMAAS